MTPQTRTILIVLACIALAVGIFMYYKKINVAALINPQGEGNLDPQPPYDPTEEKHNPKEVQKHISLGRVMLPDEGWLPKGHWDR